MSEAKIVVSAVNKTQKTFAEVKDGLGSVSDRAASLDATFGGLGAAIVAAIGAASVRAAIDTLDYLDDLSEKSGVATESLSALRYAGEVVGTPVEALATGLKKLSVTMSEGGDGLKALGISAKDSAGNLRSTESVLLDIADKFASYEDGAGKAALAQANFGKAGEELIPLLNLGREGIERLRGEAAKLGLVYGAGLAKSAADFNDNLTRLGLASEAAKVAIAGKLLPGLIELTDLFIDARKEGGLFEAALVSIGRVVAGGLGLDELGQLRSEAARTAGEIDRISNIMVGLRTTLDREPSNQAAQRRYDNLSATLKRLQGDAAATSDKMKALAGDMDKQEQSRMRNFQAPKDQKPPALADTKALTEDAKARQASLDQLNRQIAERTTLTSQELAGELALTDAQKFAITIVQSLADAKNKLTEQDKASVAATLENYLAQAKLLDERNALTKSQEEQSRFMQGYVQGIVRENQALAQQVDQYAYQTQAYGLTTRALEDLEVARVRAAQAQQLQITNDQLMVAGSDDEIRLLGERIRLINEQADAQADLIAKQRKSREDPSQGYQDAISKYVEEAKNAGDATRQITGDLVGGLESNLTDFFTKGKADWRGYFDSIIAESLRLEIIKPLLADIFGNGGKGTAGGVSSLFSGISGLVGAFGGFFAEGGTLGAGKWGVAGEAGAELIQGPATVVPLTGGGGRSVSIDMSGQTLIVGSGVSRAEVDAVVARRNAELEARLRRLSREGSFS